MCAFGTLHELGVREKLAQSSQTANEIAWEHCMTEDKQQVVTPTTAVIERLFLTADTCGGFRVFIWGAPWEPDLE